MAVFGGTAASCRRCSWHLAPAVVSHGFWRLQACSSLASSDVSSDDVVLLDARNVYETAIGHFRVPGVPLLDPQTRCFSDLPDWVDDHAQCLAGKTVLMYCTGGVRCERASAYLREKGPAFANVYQLKGGPRLLNPACHSSKHHIIYMVSSGTAVCCCRLSSSSAWICLTNHTIVEQTNISPQWFRIPGFESIIWPWRVSC